MKKSELRQMIREELLNEKSDREQVSRDVYVYPGKTLDNNARTDSIAIYAKDEAVFIDKKDIPKLIGILKN
jgi:hypothetical protein